MPAPLIINVGVFLDDVTEFNGPLFFVLGSHTHGAVKTELDDQEHQLRIARRRQRYGR